MLTSGDASESVIPVAATASLRAAVVGAVLLVFTAEPALALHHGRTTQSVVMNGKTLPPGSYVDIAYDGGDAWLTTPYDDAARIPKSAVALIPNVTFTVLVDGTVTRRTPVFSIAPALALNPGTLHQAERVPALSPGATMQIVSREGDDYLGRIRQAGVNSYGFYFGRVPVSAVAIPAEAKPAVAQDPVPLLPADGLKPRNVIPPLPSPPPPAIDFLAPVAPTLFAVVAFVAGSALALGYYFRHFTEFYAVNPGLWCFDSQSGEYRRILNRNADGTCICEQYSYSQRKAVADTDDRFVRRLCFGLLSVSCATVCLMGCEQYGDIRFGYWLNAATAYLCMASAAVSVCLFAVWPLLHGDRLGPTPLSSSERHASPHDHMFGDRGVQG